jgi:hypothetical protein
MGSLQLWMQAGRIASKIIVVEGHEKNKLGEG